MTEIKEAAKKHVTDQVYEEWFETLSPAQDKALLNLFHKTYEAGANFMLEELLKEPDTILGLSSKIVKLQRQIAKLEQENEKLFAALEVSKEVERTYSRLEAESWNKIHELQVEISKLRTEKQDWYNGAALNDLHIEQGEKIAKLTERIAELETDNVNRKCAIKDLISEKEDLEKHYAGANKEAKDYCDELFEQKDEIAKLQRQISFLKSCIKNGEQYDEQILEKI